VAYLKGRKPWLASDEYLRHRREAGRLYRNMRYAHDPEWRAKEKARATRARRKAILKSRYGISIEEYEAALTAQGGACAICKTTSWRPVVDQDPKTGALHGLLCCKCKRLVLPGLRNSTPSRVSMEGACECSYTTAPKPAVTGSSCEISCSTVLVDRSQLGHRQGLRPVRLIDVAAHDEGRRDLAQRVDHLRLADVAGVDDQIRALQRRDRFGSQRPVGVRDDPDDDLAIGHAGHPPKMGEQSTP
jgi:hypothetical protein